MHEFVLEFWTLRLVRVVARQAIGLVEGLIVVRLLEVRARSIVTIEA